MARSIFRSVALLNLTIVGRANFRTASCGFLRRYFASLVPATPCTHIDDRATSWGQMPLGHTVGVAECPLTCTFRNSIKFDFQRRRWCSLTTRSHSDRMVDRANCSQTAPERRERSLAAARSNSIGDASSRRRRAPREIKLAAAADVSIKSRRAPDLRGCPNFVYFQRKSAHADRPNRRRLALQM